MYDLKSYIKSQSFCKVLNQRITLKELTGIREVSRTRSPPTPVRTETLFFVNNSTQQQQIRTAELVAKFPETKSISLSYMFNVSAEVANEISSRVNAPFVSSALQRMSTLGESLGREVVSTRTISNEIIFKIPSQTVLCSPLKRFELKYKFYSFRDTVLLSMDFELDREKTSLCVGAVFNQSSKQFDLQHHTLDEFEFPENDANVNPINNKITITKLNGKYFLRNVPVELKFKGFEWKLQTQETDI